MTASAAKAAHAPALEMRLSVPADGVLRDVAGEVAAKIAEFLGGESDAVAAALEGLSARVAAPGGDITFEFRHIDRELVILARCNGRSSEVRYPLTA